MQADDYRQQIRGGNGSKTVACKTPFVFEVAAWLGVPRRHAQTRPEHHPKDNENAMMTALRANFCCTHTADGMRYRADSARRACADALAKI